MEDVKAPEVPGFTVGRQLGRGGSATVWLGTDQETGRQVALKCFPPAAGRARCAQRLSPDAVRREIRILSVLDHPHLVRAHDVVGLSGSLEGGAALVMDYASGGSLAGLLSSRGRLSVGETVTVLTPIAQVLAYLHGNGFTHSDISPGNVLFTGQGKPMLSDLGIARMLGEPAGGDASGTPGFVDPAPLDAVRGLQPERDVYSTAALGWFCLTGRVPGRTADRPPLSLLVPEVPRELAVALEAGLSEERRGRPDAAALATAVYRSASPEPLDLAASVHPTVIPELLTRRQVPAPSRRRAAAEKLRVAGRRIATLAWTRIPWVPALFGKASVPAPGIPFPPSGNGRPAAHGKHAGKRTPTPPRKFWSRRPRAVRYVIPPAVAAAAACVWWFSGVGGFPPQPAGAEPRPAAAAVEGTGSVHGDAPVPAPAHTADAEGGAGLAGLRQQAQARDPAAAVRGLAALRDRAFSSGDLELLKEVNAEGSGAANADGQTADQLLASGRVLAGFSSTLTDVEAEEGATHTHAVVRVVSASSAYKEMDSQGAVVGVGPASEPRRLKLVLTAVDGTWRISDILAGG